MRSAPLAVVATLALIAGGCGDSRPVVQAPAAIPADLTGAWSSGDPARPGFVSFGQRSVTIALADRPRRSAAPESCTAEPGIGAGEIRLADGTRLFLSTGTEARERRIGDLRLIENARWLDLTIETAGQPASQCRLWSAQTTQAPMALMSAPAPLPAPMAVPAPAPAALPAPAPAAKTDPDAILADTVGERRPDALALIGLRSGGAPRSSVIDSFAERQCGAWQRVLGELTAAQADPGGAGIHLAAAARLHHDAEAFRAAVQTWLATRD